MRKNVWDSLAVETEGSGTVCQALEQSGLLWDVVKRPLMCDLGNEIVPVSGRYATVRSDTGTPLGVVSDSYTVIQNQEAFGIIDGIVQNSDWQFSKAGLMNDGARVFVVLKMEQDMLIGDDLVNKYLLIITSHDGSLALQARITPNRVFCTNQLTGIMKRDDGFSIYHTGGYREQIRYAAEVIGTVNRRYSSLESEFNRLLGIKMNEREFVEFTKVLVPDIEDKDKNNTYRLNQREKLLSYFRFGSGIEHIRDTRWAAYNAVTEYIDHGKDLAVTSVNAHQKLSQRMNSLTFGHGLEFKHQALSLLRAG